MEFYFRKADLFEFESALGLLKEAAENLRSKNIQQWQFWLDPPPDKLKWIRDGFENNEFYFIESPQGQLYGMFRLQSKDELYWGHQEVEARYIHSFVVRKEFAGLNIGSSVIRKIESDMLLQGLKLLRLDCNSQNLGLCKYYLNLGFVKVGEKQMPHALNNLYEKRLS